MMDDEEKNDWEDDEEKNDRAGKDEDSMALSSGALKPKETESTLSLVTFHREGPDTAENEQEGLPEPTQQKIHVTLREARRYGIKERQGGKQSSIFKYYYAGHVFVHDEARQRTLKRFTYDRLCDLFLPPVNKNKAKTKQTSQRPSRSTIQSGTRFTQPLLVRLSKDHTSSGMVVAHDMATDYLQKNHQLWTSHTVIVVDMSGSMREDDVNGARCRADGVWTTLARNFCRSQLESQSNSLYDVVSVIAMRKTAKVLISCEPLTWVLYNKFVDFREWDNIKPHGHGFYKPALQKAEELLTVNNHGFCALSLMFFSDGKPSDFCKELDFSRYHYQEVEKEPISQCGQLASKFGRRLSMTFVGMANNNEPYAALRRMAKEAKQFGAMAEFHQPTLTTDSLSQVISSSVATSLSTKTELSRQGVGSGAARSVRMDVQREKQNEPDSKKPNPAEWRIFCDSRRGYNVRRIWTWSDQRHEFVTLVDTRCQSCTKPVADADYQSIAEGGMKCPTCEACFFCERCVSAGTMRNHQENEECTKCLQDHQDGVLIMGHPVLPYMSYNVAWKRKAFGEGAERLAYKFRFTDPKGRKFVGPLMVAKESRFVEDLEENQRSQQTHNEEETEKDKYRTSQRHSYHKTFMRTQSIASQYASRFNERLEKRLSSDQISYVPRIVFVKPLVFELEAYVPYEPNVPWKDDVDSNRNEMPMDGSLEKEEQTSKTYNVLVEPFIEGHYRKFVDNHGGDRQGVATIGTQNQGIDSVGTALLLGRRLGDKKDSMGSLSFDEEATDQEDQDDGKENDLCIIEEGEEDEEEYESDEEQESENDQTLDVCLDVSTIRDSDYLKAFSHFSHVNSRGSLMVVDLQGTLQRTVAAPRKTYVLTDPAIHQRFRKKKKRQFGRTDLGFEGIKAFFATHECNDVCRFLGLRDRKKPDEQQQPQQETKPEVEKTPRQGQICSSEEM